MEPVFDRKFFRELLENLREKIEDLIVYIQKHQVGALIVLTLVVFLVFVQQIILIALSR